MIIVVEGSDLTGKTTFVQELKKQVPAALVIHSGPPKDLRADPFEEYEVRLYEALDQGRPIICDRLHWGERVYGPLMRGYDRLDVAGWRHVELFLAAHGAMVVYLHQPSSVLVERLRSRGDSLINGEHLFHIDQGYQWMLRNTILPTISLRDPDENDARRVIQWAKAAEAPNVPYFESYIGKLNPRWLLFGEKRGGQPPHVHRSAFVPKKMTSGFVLLTNLPEQFWPHVGIANALEENPLHVWALAGHPPVIALGHEAAKALTAAGVPHAKVPHPQYVRRFLHSKQSEYGDLILRVAGTQEDLMKWRGDDPAE